MTTTTLVTLVQPGAPALCWKKRSEGEKPGGIPLRNPYCLSMASLRILGRPPGFSAFGGFGLDLLVLLGQCQKDASFSPQLILAINPN